MFLCQISKLNLSVSISISTDSLSKGKVIRCCVLTKQTTPKKYSNIEILLVKLIYIYQYDFLKNDSSHIELYRIV